jgi:hypothetical protein
MTDSQESNSMASEEAWRRECARRVLLDHLGIMPLVSRFDAIGAKATVRQLEPAVPVEVATVFESGMATADKPGDGLRQRLRTDHALPIQEAPVGRDADRHNIASLSPQGTSTKTSPENQSSASEAPLSLLMAITGDVLWIETLEDQLLRREQLQLIGAMARAIRGPDVRTTHQQFDWPPRSGPALSAHSGGLTGILTGFLQRLITDHDARIIIQLGQVAALPALQAPVYELPSTLAMLREGSCKRSAWAVLKPLQQSG